MELQPESALRPASDSSRTARDRKAWLRMALRQRRVKAKGSSSNALHTVPVEVKPPGPKGAGCKAPMMEALVETVSTELCAALLAAVKVRLVGINPHDAELGSDPQENVNVPAKPFAGVTVNVVEAVAP